MSTVKSKNLQVGTDATATNNFTIYQPSTPDGTLRIGVGNADSPTEVGRFTSAGYKPATAPAFSAYASSSTSMTATAWTKIQFNTEEYDTNSNYDTSNYRFTPTVAGYYFLSGTWIAASAFCFGMASIYKNGSRYRDGASHGYSTNNSNGFSASGLVYANGSTDYFEFYGQSNVTNTATTGVSGCHFCGVLIQQA